MGLGCLSGPKVVTHGPKSKLALPKVIIRGQINPSIKVSEVAQKNISFMSSNGPPGNYCKVLNEHVTGHVLVGKNGGFTKMPIDF